MRLKRFEKKKLLGRNSNNANMLFNYLFKKIQKQPPEVFDKETVLRKFVIASGKCSVKKLVLVVDGGVKLTCSYIA